MAKFELNILPAAPRASGSAWVKLIGVLLAIPLLYFVLRGALTAVAERSVFDGDTIGRRDCRECGGKGVDEKQAKDFSGIPMKCPACNGHGTVEVITPGPHHPVKIHGVVVDWEASDSSIAARPPSNIALGFGASLLKTDRERDIPGGLPGIRVKFEVGEDVITSTTGRSGRFHLVLAPGVYSVHIEAPGFGPFTERLEIEPLKADIWPEKARIIRSRTFEERRSQDGQALVLVLEKAKTGDGFLRLYSVPE
jgi:hypothetical protein